MGLAYPLFHYQEVGRDFLASRERVGLFDEMGLGKSAQVIAAMDKLVLRRALIICPASVRGVWLSEFKKFADTPRRVLRGTTLHELELWKCGKADVLIVSYEQATRWLRYLQEDVIEVIVVDEMHYCKNHGTARTKAIYGGKCDGATGIARWGARVWLLSGTPMANDPTDVWTWMRFCGATELSLANFTQRYFSCKPGAFNMSFKPRPDMIAELKERIKRFSLRRTKQQAGVDLPPVHIVTQAVEGDTKEIRQLLREVPGLDSTILRAVEKGGLSFLDAQHIGTLRRLVGTAKAPAYAAQLVEELAVHGDKVVVIGIHRDVLSHLEAHLAKHRIQSVKIDGACSAQQRDAAVLAFQTDPLVRVFIGNIKAAGVGLTLTAGFRIDMLEWSWAPADNAQALMRVHRIGQTREVQARFISLYNSVDERVSAAVARKTAAIALIEGP